MRRLRVLAALAFGVLGATGAGAQIVLDPIGPEDLETLPCGQASARACLFALGYNNFVGIEDAERRFYAIAPVLDKVSDKLTPDEMQLLIDLAYTEARDKPLGTLALYRHHAGAGRTEAAAEALKQARGELTGLSDTGFAMKTRARLVCTRAKAEGAEAGVAELAMLRGEILSASSPEQAVRLLRLLISENDFCARNWPAERFLTPVTALVGELSQQQGGQTGWAYDRYLELVDMVARSDRSELVGQTGDLFKLAEAAARARGEGYPRDSALGDVAVAALRKDLVVTGFRLAKEVEGTDSGGRLNLVLCVKEAEAGRIDAARAHLAEVSGLRTRCHVALGHALGKAAGRSGEMGALRAQIADTVPASDQARMRAAAAAELIRLGAPALGAELITEITDPDLRDSAIESAAWALSKDVSATLSVAQLFPDSLTARRVALEALLEAHKSDQAWAFVQAATSAEVRVILLEDFVDDRLDRGYLERLAEPMDALKRLGSTNTLLPARYIQAIGETGRADLCLSLAEGFEEAFQSNAARVTCIEAYLRRGEPRRALELAGELEQGQFRGRAYLSIAATVPTE